MLGVQLGVGSSTWHTHNTHTHTHLFVVVVVVGGGGTHHSHVLPSCCHLRQGRCTTGMHSRDPLGILSWTSGKCSKNSCTKCEVVVKTTFQSIAFHSRCMASIPCVCTLVCLYPGMSVPRCVCLYPGMSVPRCVCTPVCLYPGVSVPRCVCTPGVSVPRCVCTPVCLYPGVSVSRCVCTPACLYPGVSVPPVCLYPGVSVPRCVCPSPPPLQYMILIAVASVLQVAAGGLAVSQDANVSETTCFTPDRQPPPLMSPSPPLPCPSHTVEGHSCIRADCVHGKLPASHGLPNGLQQSSSKGWLTPPTSSQGLHVMFCDG